MLPSRLENCYDVLLAPLAYLPEAHCGIRPLDLSSHSQVPVTSAIAFLLSNFMVLTRLSMQFSMGEFVVVVRSCLDGCVF